VSLEVEHEYSIRDKSLLFLFPVSDGGSGEFTEKCMQCICQVNVRRVLYINIFLPNHTCAHAYIVISSYF